MHDLVHDVSALNFNCFILAHYVSYNKLGHVLLQPVEPIESFFKSESRVLYMFCYLRLWSFYDFLLLFVTLVVLYELFFVKKAADKVLTVFDAELLLVFIEPHIKEAILNFKVPHGQCNLLHL